jgi:very-short-patch-repair endonuclease
VTPVVAAFGLAALLGDVGPSRRQVELLLELAARFRAPSLPPASLLSAPQWRTTEASVAQAAAIGRRRAQLWQPLAVRWRPEVLGADLDRLAVEHARAADAFVVVRWFRMPAVRRALLPFCVAGSVGAIAEVRADLERLRQVRDEERALAAAAVGGAAAVLGPTFVDGRADWQQVDDWLLWVRDVRRLVLELVPGSLQPEAGVLAALGTCLDAIATGATALPRSFGALQLAADERQAALQLVRTPLQLDVDAAFGDPAAPGWHAAIAARTARMLAAVPALREHCAWWDAAQAAQAAGAGPLVQAHTHGAVATARLVPAFERGSLEAWLDQVHAAEPLLARFRGLDHERAIARFAELDGRAIRLAAEVVQARLAAQVPQMRDTQVASSELGILERERKKQRRHKPVRRLFAEIPGLLTRLAPCMLMSPLSVAQFLGRGSRPFDLVVFDEASQIPMPDAVGAIGRGRALVVVGDSRQLPPTTFFQRLEQGDEPGSDDVPEDLESVLDECGAAGLPRLHLDWHYRSRHESLIAFSNHHYYRNRLLTFPAPRQRSDGNGVRCVVVPGVYDRAGSQQNRIEAAALVAEVVERLRDPARAAQSLGIVTFSRAQQVLVEDLLDAARAAHPEVEAGFAADEPVFVKNLENVQGDERDVILFSICYGPDAAGKVYENYGPLNLQGGERRLNVAVTRARVELVVFTSLRPEQVATRTQALGARHLRAFLDYALRGEAALAAAVAVDPSGEPESPFEVAVRDELVRRGHTVHTQVGCGGYRIDLAVVDPDAPGRYLLGIECDGATYHAAATARDRDRLRAAVLRGLGWRLHRIWSTDFWQDPAGELARAEAAIAAAKAAVPVAATVTAPTRLAANAAVPEVVSSDRLPVAPPAAVAPVEPSAPPPPVDPHGPRVHTVPALAAVGTPESFAEDRAARSLRRCIELVLAAEAPVVFDRLARTVATAFGVQRLTDRIRDRVRAHLPATAHAADDVLWATAADAEVFTGFRTPADDGAGTRAADELPAVEIRNAMVWLLRQHQALAEDDLAREAARCFGITRLGSVVRATMQKALDELVAAGRGRRDGDVVRLP